MMKIKVAKSIIELDMPDVFFGEYMPLFAYPGSRPNDVNIKLSNKKLPVMPYDAVMETNVPVHTVYKHGAYRYCVRTETDNITYFKYDEGCTRFTININDRINCGKPGWAEDEDLKTEAAILLKRIFIMLIAARNGVNLHSSSIRYSGYALLFSAGSGTGKTTHTNIWKAALPEVEIINGDNGYCFYENGTAYIYGAPWCGTSGECTDTKAPIRAVVFLEQAKENQILRLASPEAFMRFAARCFMPAWDKGLMIKAIETAEKITSSVDCYMLKCLPDRGAMELVRKCVEI